MQAASAIRQLHLWFNSLWCDNKVLDTQYAFDLLISSAHAVLLTQVWQTDCGKKKCRMWALEHKQSTRSRLKFWCIGAKSLPYKNSSIPRTISDWNVTPTETIMNLRTSVSMMADQCCARCFAECTPETCVQWSASFDTANLPLCRWTPKRMDVSDGLIYVRLAEAT